MALLCRHYCKGKEAVDEKRRAYRTPWRRLSDFPPVVIAVKVQSFGLGITGNTKLLSCH
jgi:hypothetical protein